MTEKELYSGASNAQRAQYKQADIVAMKAAVDAGAMKYEEYVTFLLWFLMNFIKRRKRIYEEIYK